MIDRRQKFVWFDVLGACTVIWRERRWALEHTLNIGTVLIAIAAVRKQASGQDRKVGGALFDRCRRTFNLLPCDRQIPTVVVEFKISGAAARADLRTASDGVDAGASGR